MRIAVCGLWHLGCVTAAGAAAAGHDVIGLDADGGVVTGLRQGRAPISEPGLDAQIADGLAAGRLTFTTEPRDALADAEALWVAFDTPVDDQDQADVAAVRAQLESVGPWLRPGTLVLVSSQVPVGFTRALAADWSGRGLAFASLPENLRLGRALECFARPDRVVIGLEQDADRARLEPLLTAMRWPIEWMSLESAEMTKHALNALLATTVTFVNELARVCESVGADVKAVERGLKSDARIGARPYLAPGGPLAGGTLARDLRYLSALGRTRSVGTPLVDGVLASNAQHEGWVRRQVAHALLGVTAPVAAVLGLAYKPGTSTLRRSSALQLCRWLVERSVSVRAHDPAVPTDSPELPPQVQRAGSAAEALDGADVAVLATGWPEYRTLGADEIRRRMRRPLVIDQTWELAALAAADGLTYVAPGRPLGGA